MSHRVKNLFAIAAALTAIAARSAATTTEMARDPTQRLTALGRAHDLVRPIPGQEEAAGRLPVRDLLAALLAPYDDRGAIGDRIRVSMKRRVSAKPRRRRCAGGPRAATNSIKYGALSVAGGALYLSCIDHNDDW